MAAELGGKEFMQIEMDHGMSRAVGFYFSTSLAIKKSESLVMGVLFPSNTPRTVIDQAQYSVNALP